MAKLRKIAGWLLIAVFLAAVAAAATLYYVAFSPNVKKPQNRQYTYFYVHTGWTFDDVYTQLQKQNLLKHPKTFLLTAKLKRFEKPRPGRYKITANTTNNELINKLRAGLQEPVRLTIGIIRTPEQLAGYVSKHLETDSLSLIKLLKNPLFLDKYGFNPDNVLAMFIQNTYEFWWNTSATKFFKRMYKEYNKFWTPQRKEKARQIGLSPIEVAILASIVEAEQMQHPDEWPRIAGLYINRLKRDIPLQSDPTLVYAWKSFGIRRVYNYHKDIDSPYNTYKYKGLPPGPIMTPDPRAIDAVLNYERHNYLFMVARDDFSGYHYFTTNLRDHLYYARKYQRALNERGIK